MTSVIILGFLVGFLFAGALPHFIKGVMGKAFRMPFGLPESPTASVLWAWVSGVVAVILFHLAPMRFHARAASLGISVGVLVAGLMMANMKYKTARHSHTDEA